MRSVGRLGPVRIDDIENLEHLPGLLVTVADHHAADGGVIQRAATLFKVADDVIEHRLDKARVGIDKLAVDVALLKFHGSERFLQREFVVGGDFFADQAQGIAVGDRRVVVVLVDVIAEQTA